MPPLTDAPCNDGSGPGLISSGLPEECKVVQPCQPVPCIKLPCKKCKRNGQKAMKYIQPPVRASFKPESSYKMSDYALESNTVYRLSYPGVEGEIMKECRPKNVFWTDNIKPSSMPFSQDTTFKLSFTGVAGDKAVSCKPLYRNMMGSGPMQSITTHRHDYPPKISERPTPIRNNNTICLSSAKMESGTTMALSYQPVVGERAASFKPIGTYKKSEYKLEQDTVHRLSFQPWDPIPKEIYPWQMRESYRQPNYKMECNTIYRGSYITPDNYVRSIPVKPIQEIGVMACNRPLESATIYKESYQDNGVIQRPVQVVRQGNIFLSTQPMSQETTARLSYTGVEGEKAIPCKPLLRNMMGTGPMQSVTTQRHDYTPKPIPCTESYKPKYSLPCSAYKMEDTTTFRASYLPNENLAKAESFKPVVTYRKSTMPFESDTINRLSFQPWSPMPKEEYPWAKPPKYEQPNRAMDGTSIYRGSFLAPGGFVEEDICGDNGVCDCQCSATEDL